MGVRGHYRGGSGGDGGTTEGAVGVRGHYRGGSGGGGALQRGQWG